LSCSSVTNRGTQHREFALEAKSDDETSVQIPDIDAAITLVTEYLDLFSHAIGREPNDWELLDFDAGGPAVYPDSTRHFGKRKRNLSTSLRHRVDCVY
jgi:hypothetical protein